MSVLWKCLPSFCKGRVKPTPRNESSHPKTSFESKLCNCSVISYKMIQMHARLYELTRPELLVRPCLYRKPAGLVEDGTGCACATLSAKVRLWITTQVVAVRRQGRRGRESIGQYLIAAQPQTHGSRRGIRHSTAVIANAPMTIVATAAVRDTLHEPVTARFWPVTHGLSASRKARRTPGRVSHRHKINQPLPTRVPEYNS